MRRLIFAGYGIGCLPEHIVRDDIAQQRLWRLPPDDAAVDVDVFLQASRSQDERGRARVLDAMERCMQRYSLAERLK